MFRKVKWGISKGHAKQSCIFKVVSFNIDFFLLGSNKFTIIFSNDRWNVLWTFKSVAISNQDPIVLR